MKIPFSILWHGPIKLGDMSKQPPENTKTTGVYLWCSKLNEHRFCVNYIGSAPVNYISKRIQVEISKFREYSLIDYQSFNGEMNEEKKEIDIIMCNVWESDNQEVLVESNSKNPYIFYFPIDEKLKDIAEEYKQKTLNNFIREIEGSIKLFFWRKGKTRRYLTYMEHPRYEINPNDLVMEVEDQSISIVGINN